MMTFQEKVKFLRTLPQFKVIPISEVRALAFAASIKNGKVYLGKDDIQKILREYPDLQHKF